MQSWAQQRAAAVANVRRDLDGEGEEVKHSTPESIKFKKLQRRLGITRYATIGVLESLWIATIKNAPRGDIGRFDDETIAIECEWDKDAGLLVSALIECGWLDRSEEHRLVVHDWHDHAPYFVRGVVAKSGGFLSLQNPCAEECKKELKTPTIVADYSAPTNDGDNTDQQPNLTQRNVTKPNLNNDASHQSYPPEFEQFWKAYPVNAKGRKVGKKATLALWRKIPASDRGLLMEAATAYGREQTEFVRDPERFLKSDYWRDFTTPAEKPVRKSRVATAEDLATWSPYGDYE